jgi:hypothetical protein
LLLRYIIKYGDVLYWGRGRLQLIMYDKNIAIIIKEELDLL